jgi:hypothetical protein
MSAKYTDRLTQAIGIFAQENSKKLWITPSFEAAHGAASRVYLQQSGAKPMIHR